MYGDTREGTATSVMTSIQQGIAADRNPSGIGVHCISRDLVNDHCEVTKVIAQNRLYNIIGLSYGITP